MVNNMTSTPPTIVESVKKLFTTQLCSLLPITLQEKSDVEKLLDILDFTDLTNDSANLDSQLEQPIKIEVTPSLEALEVEQLPTTSTAGEPEESANFSEFLVDDGEEESGAQNTFGAIGFCRRCNKQVPPNELRGHVAECRRNAIANTARATASRGRPRIKDEASRPRGRPRVHAKVENPQPRKKRDPESKEKRKERYLCKVCGKQLSSKISYNSHIAIYHESDTAEKTVCPVCGKTLLKVQIDTHMKSRHSNDDAVCEFCPNKPRFSTRFNLRKHIVFHHEGKGHLCGVCGRKFNTAARLQYHENEHRGIKSVACSLCPEKFIHPWQRLKHLRVVHGHQKLARVTCPHCEGEYERHSIKEHINAHMGIKPHKCPDCDYRSSYSGACYTHRKTVHKNVGPDAKRNEVPLSLAL